MSAASGVRRAPSAMRRTDPPPRSRTSSSVMTVFDDSSAVTVLCDESAGTVSMKRLEVVDEADAGSSGRALSITSRTRARMRSRVVLSSISLVSKQETVNGKQLTVRNHAALVGFSKIRSRHYPSVDCCLLLTVYCSLFAVCCSLVHSFTLAIHPADQAVVPPKL